MRTRSTYVIADESDARTSGFEGDELETLELHAELRANLIRKVRRLTTRLRKQMMSNVTINGSWYKLFKHYGKNSSGHIGFEELEYVVYKELEVSRLEITPRELRLVWSLIDDDGSGGVSVEEFAAFMRRIETNRIDHVIVAAVDKQIVVGQAASPGDSQYSLGRGPSLDKWTTGTTTGTASRASFSVATGGTLRTGATGAATAAELTDWLRSYRTICGYSSLGRTRGLQMGRPPEDNESVRNLVPRMELDLVTRQEQRAVFSETLAGGGARYPLMKRLRTADLPYALEEDLGTLHLHTRPPPRTAPTSLPPDGRFGASGPQSLASLRLSSHFDSSWSERLACVPTHSQLARQHRKVADLKLKYKLQKL